VLLANLNIDAAIPLGGQRNCESGHEVLRSRFEAATSRTQLTLAKNKTAGVMAAVGQYNKMDVSSVITRCL
jgi:hypothetical protein